MAKRVVLFDLEDLPGWGLKTVFGGEHGDGSSNYLQTHTGANVSVYLVSSSVMGTHVEFQKNDTPIQFTPLLGTTTSPQELSEGTRLSSIICGNYLGVAPSTKIISCPIDTSMKSSKQVTSMLSSVVEHFKSHKNSEPAILCLPMNSPWDHQLDQMVSQLYELGMIPLIHLEERHCEDLDRSMYPGLSHAIIVGAFNNKLQLHAPHNQQRYDLVAPSEKIRVADSSDAQSYHHSNDPQLSLAYATGALACFLDKHPHLKPFEVKEAFVSSCFKMLGNTDCPIVFNSAQELKPKWKNTDSLFGVFQWGDEISGQLKCQGRTGETLTFELIEGELPKGLHFSNEFGFSGKINHTNAYESTEYFNFLIRAKDTNGSTDRLVYFILAKPSEVEELKVTQGVVSLAGFKFPCDRWCNSGPPPFHSCCCFSEETLISTEHGLKEIKDIQIGDVVYSPDHQLNIVLDINIVPLGDRLLYGLNNHSPFFTSEHPFLGPNGELAISPQLCSNLTKRKTTPLIEGAQVYSQEGLLKIDKINSSHGNKSQLVYNLVVSGGGSYLANTFGVSGKFILGTESMPFAQRSV